MKMVIQVTSHEGLKKKRWIQVTSHEGLKKRDGYMLPIIKD